MTSWKTNRGSKGWKLQNAKTEIVCGFFVQNKKTKIVQMLKALKLY